MDTLRHVGGSNKHSLTEAAQWAITSIRFAEDHINGGYGDILDQLNAEDRFSEEYPDLDEPWDTIVAQQELEDFEQADRSISGTSAATRTGKDTSHHGAIA